MAILWVILVLAVLESTSSGQSTSGYPAWYLMEEVGDLYLPPEYAGAYPDRVRIQFSKKNCFRPSNNAVVISTPTSGILAIADRRGGQLTRLSWDTGFGRVHFTTRIGQRDDVPARFLLCLWDAVASRSRLAVLTIPETGPMSQQLLGPVSPTNQLWTAAAIIDGAVYLFDAQNSTIRRCVDTDADGIVDALDSSFMVLVPQDETVDRIALLTSPIVGFKKTPGGDIGIWNATNNDVVLKLDPVGGPPLLEIGTKLEDPLIRLGGSLIAGQKCVFVFGTPGTEFVIKKRDAEDLWIAASKTWTIPASGAVAADLLAPLVLGDRLSAQPTAVSNEVGVSHEWTVNSTKEAVLFEILPSRRMRQGETVKLFGDGFLPGHRVHYKSDYGTGILATTYVNRGAMNVQLPMIGPGSSNPPLPNSSATLIWVERVGAPGAVSNLRVLEVAHD